MQRVDARPHRGGHDEAGKDERHEQAQLPERQCEHDHADYDEGSDECLARGLCHFQRLLAIPRAGKPIRRATANCLAICSSGANPATAVTQDNRQTEARLPSEMETPETTVDDHDAIRAGAQPERPPAPVVAKRRFADASAKRVPHDKVQRHARVRRGDYPDHDGQYT